VLMRSSPVTSFRVDALEDGEAVSRQHVARPVWPVTTHQGELTARRLVITFVPTTGRKLGGLPSGGCGDSNTERKLPADKVYRRDDRGIVGVESFIA